MDNELDGALTQLEEVIGNEQEARANLRERFLRITMALNGKDAKFQMYGNVCVEAEFGGLGVDFQEVFVKKLKTPMGVLNSALLRSNDIISIRIPLKTTSSDVNN